MVSNLGGVPELGKALKPPKSLSLDLEHGPLERRARASTTTDSPMTPTDASRMRYTFHIPFKNYTAVVFM